MEVKDLAWRKATRSNGGANACVEVAADGRSVYVRDTKRREAGHITVTSTAWREFVSRITNR